VQFRIAVVGHRNWEAAITEALLAEVAHATQVDRGKLEARLAEASPWLVDLDSPDTAETLRQRWEARHEGVHLTVYPLRAPVEPVPTPAGPWAEPTVLLRDEVPTTSADFTRAGRGAGRGRRPLRPRCRPLRQTSPVPAEVPATSDEVPTTSAEFARTGRGAGRGADHFGEVRPSPDDGCARAGGAAAHDAAAGSRAGHAHRGAAPPDVVAFRGLPGRRWARHRAELAGLVQGAARGRPAGHAGVTPCAEGPGHYALELDGNPQRYERGDETGRCVEDPTRNPMGCAPPALLNGVRTLALGLTGGLDLVLTLPSGADATLEPGTYEVAGITDDAPMASSNRPMCGAWTGTVTVDALTWRNRPRATMHARWDPQEVSVQWDLRCQHGQPAKFRGCWVYGASGHPVGFRRSVDGGLGRRFRREDDLRVRPRLRLDGGLTLGGPLAAHPLHECPRRGTRT
jgi:hypothetical protein